MATQVAHRLEVRHNLLRLRNGRLVEREFGPVWDGDTDIGFLWKFEDITESYKAEKGLQLREEKYRTIIDNMQLGLVETDLEKRVLYANPNYCAPHWLHQRGAARQPAAFAADALRQPAAHRAGIPAARTRQ